MWLSGCLRGHISALQEARASTQGMNMSNNIELCSLDATLLSTFIHVTQIFEILLWVLLYINCLTMVQSESQTLKKNQWTKYPMPCTIKINEYRHQFELNNRPLLLVNQTQWVQIPQWKDARTFLWCSRCRLHFPEPGWTCTGWPPHRISLSPFPWVGHEGCMWRKRLY